MRLKTRRNYSIYEELINFATKNEERMNVNSLTALKLRKLREEEGISQEDLAARVGLSPAQIGRIENGKVEITLLHLEVFSKYFQKSIFELIGQKTGTTSHWHQPKGIIQNGESNHFQCQLSPEVLEKIMTLVSDVDRK